MNVKLPPSVPPIRTELAYGTHSFGLRHGPSVTGISEGSWAAFAQSLARLERPGDYILSPELITSASVPLSGVAREQAQIEDRIGQAQELSGNYPDSTLILGTALFSEAHAKPRNALLFLRGGQEIGRTYKMPYMIDVVRPETQHFEHIASATDCARPSSDTLAIICSDLQFHRQTTHFKQQQLPEDAVYKDPLTEETKTLLVSACWATPVITSESMPRSPERFLAPLQFSVNALFARYRHLQDIVITDRLPAPASIDTPLNLHFQRTS